MGHIQVPVFPEHTACWTQGTSPSKLPLVGGASSSRAAVREAPLAGVGGGHRNFQELNPFFSTVGGSMLSVRTAC